jgi:hypothetical protein
VRIVIAIYSPAQEGSVEKNSLAFSIANFGNYVAPIKPVLGMLEWDSGGISNLLPISGISENQW